MTNLWQWVRCDVSELLLTQDWCASLVNYQTLFVGFSGGLDSTVLLHSIAKQPALINKLKVVHVHHGLSKNAHVWQAHCEQFCETLSVPLLVREVQIDTNANIEEAARIARYQVFSSLLTENDCLLLGHHMDDQAETLLLQLFRGAGIDGMAAMLPLTALTKGVLARPLLQHSRENIEAYAKQYQLSWVNDESNQNNAFSRNYLRQQIMPLLREKWPGIAGNVARSASHCQQAKLNLEALAEIDCAKLGAASDKLSLSCLLTLPRTRLANILRVWLRKNQVRCPSTAMLERLMDEVILTREDATPIVEWERIAVRRYQQTLYLLKGGVLDKPSPSEWPAFPAPLQVGDELYVAPPGMKVPQGAHIHLRFRQGGELFYWHGQTKQLKKLFQQWQIPPWQRDRIPLLYVDNELAAVIGFAISDYYRDSNG